MLAKRIVLGISLLILAGTSQAQYHEDVFRYSRQNYQGSARTMGLAGAWGAVGADMSSTSINPAGLGLYRKNEFMAAVSFNSFSSNTTYGGSEISDYRLGFNIPNFGLVVTNLNQYKGKSATQGLVSYSFAFGVNRLADYQQNIEYSGKNRNTTVGDFLAQSAQGRDSANFLSSDYDNTLSALAWRVRLMDNTGGRSTYASIQKLQGDTNYFVNHFQQLKLRGRASEWYVSGGMNLSNFVYLGASLVFQDVNFTSNTSLTEDLLSSTVSNNVYKSSIINQYVNTKGSGVGAKIGAIVRPLDFLKLGASYHTAVILNLTDYYRNDLTMVYSDGRSFTEPAEDREDFFEYQLRTPARYNVSGALTIAKFALVTVDYEQVDYSTGKLSAEGFSYDKENTRVRTLYGKSTNIRTGLEIKYEDLRFRAGYAMLGSPFKEDYISAEDGKRTLISAGFGWIYNQDYFFDLGVNQVSGKDLYTPYDGANQNAVNSFNRLMVSFGGGVRF
jgi:hypothetical protein